MKPITSKFPTLCALQDTVTHGGLISYHIPWKIICQKAADFGVKLLNGLDINKVVISPKNKKIIINKETANIFKNLKELDKFRTPNLS